MDDSFEIDARPVTKRVRPNSRVTKRDSTVKKGDEVDELFKSLDIFINDEPEKPTSTSTGNRGLKKKSDEDAVVHKSRDASKEPHTEKEQAEAKGGRVRKGKNKKNEPTTIIEEALPQETIKPEKGPKDKGGKKKVAEEKEDKSKARKPAPAPSHSSMTGSPEEIVLEYMRKQNRPYSLINIFDNLHAKYKKQDLQKILDRHVKDKKLIEKEFGKCLVYWYNQDLIEVNQERLEAEGERYAIAKGTVDTLKKSLQEVKAKLAQIDKIPTTDSFKDQIKKCEQEIPALETKLQRYQNNSEPMASVEQITSLESSIVDLEKLRAKRRKMFNNMIDTLMEQTSLPKKKLLEKIGLEWSHC